MSTSQPPFPSRPQEPLPPFPYATENVVFENPQAGIRLAGTLTLPPGPGPHPAALLLCGSGPGDRDEAIAGHRPFFVLADHLTRAGIAVLRYDKRGVGQSSGPADIWQSTFQDFAQDALAGLAFLQARPEVDPARIGLIGHSEGGKVAPLTARQWPGAAFVVILASSALSEEAIILSQMEAIGRAMGQPESAVAQVVENHRMVFALLREEADIPAARRELVRLFQEKEPGKPEEQILLEWGGFLSPFFQFGLAYDPTATLQKLSCPVLVLQGGRDLQVLADANLPSLRQALAGNPDATFMVLAQLNHMFQTCQTGSPAEYGGIEETFAPQALRAIAEWVSRRVGLKK